MTRKIATVLLVCGIGVFVYGATGYKGRGGIDGVRSAGWDDSSKAIMAAGAMLTAGGWIYRDRKGGE